MATRWRHDVKTMATRCENDGDEVLRVATTSALERKGVRMIMLIIIVNVRNKGCMSEERKRYAKDRK